MRRPHLSLSLPLAVVAVAALSASAAARPHHAAPAGPPESGFQLAAGLGLNVCIADDTADCDGLGASVDVFAAPGYRFSDTLSLSLDVEVGLLNPEGDVSMTTYSVMPTLRGHFRAGQGEFVIGGGIGYSGFDISGDGYYEDASGYERYGTMSFTWSTFLAFKLTAGYVFEISPTLSLGGQITLHVNPASGEACVDVDGSKECADMDSDGNVAERLSLGLFLINRF